MPGHMLQNVLGSSKDSGWKAAFSLNVCRIVFIDASFPPVAHLFSILAMKRGRNGRFVDNGSKWTFLVAALWYDPIRAWHNVDDHISIATHAECPSEQAVSADPTGAAQVERTNCWAMWQREQIYGSIYVSSIGDSKKKAMKDQHQGYGSAWADVFWWSLKTRWFVSMSST